MTDLKTKLAVLHPNMTPGTWMAEYDPVSAQDHATFIELAGKAGASGTRIARTEHNWNDAIYNERRISWKEAENNAEWIALTGSEGNRAQIIAALEAVEEAQAYFEDIASLTENPLYNPLEVGFRHSPLSPKEREERYATACSMAWQSAQRGIALKGVKHGAD